jgi:hypothetical protein
MLRRGYTWVSSRDDRELEAQLRDAIAPRRSASRRGHPGPARQPDRGDPGLSAGRRARARGSRLRQARRREEGRRRVRGRRGLGARRPAVPKARGPRPRRRLLREVGCPLGPARRRRVLLRDGRAPEGGSHLPGPRGLREGRRLLRQGRRSRLARRRADHARERRPRQDDRPGAQEGALAKGRPRSRSRQAPTTGPPRAFDEAGELRKAAGIFEKALKKYDVAAALMIEAG